MLGVAALQFADRIHCEAGAGALLEVTHPDRRASRHPLRRREPRGERCHILCAFLQRIAGRYEPPHLVEAERPQRLEADAPVSPVSGIERAAEETDAGHAAELA